MFKLISLYDFVFLQNFESVALASVFFDNEKHFTIRTFAYDGYCVKVLGSDFSCFGLSGVHDGLIVFNLCFSVYLKLFRTACH